MPSSFLILGQHVQVNCGNAALASIIEANYAAMAAEFGERIADLHYVVSDAPAGQAFALTRPSQPAVEVADAGELLFHLEKDVTVALQHKRPDLLFLHAAALEYGGKAWLLAGDSGNGKSTTAWGLLHHGFRYLSDELSPIDLGSLQVLAYPHALCLKQRPPPSYPLPVADVLDLGARLHVPVRLLPGGAVVEPCELAGVVFVSYREHLPAPVLHIAKRVPCFRVDCADLRLTCDLIGRLFMAPRETRAAAPANAPALLPAAGGRHPAAGPA